MKVRRGNVRAGIPVALCALVALAGQAYGQPVVISVPADTTVYRGGAVYLPIRTTMLSEGDSVIGFNFAVVFPMNVLKLDSTKVKIKSQTPTGTIYRYDNVIRGALTSAGLFDNALVGDTIRVVWSNSSPIVGSGTMFSIGFGVRDDAPSLTTGEVKIVKLNGLYYLNEGKPVSVAQNGVVRVGWPVAVSEERPQRLGPAISAWPNPFNPRVNLRLNGPYADELGAGPIEGVIVNPLGQVIRRWTMAGSRGEVAWTWDGLDESGRPVSSGVYLVMIGRERVWHRTVVTLLR